MTTAIYGNSLYTIVEGPEWTTAQDNAIDAGGFLVALSTKEEENFVKNFIKPLPTLDEGWWWMGAVETSDTNLWSWSNGEEWDYENWYEGLPFAYPGSGGYAEFRYDSSDFSGFIDAEENDGDWATTFNSSERNGVAEIPLNLSADLPETVEEGTEFTVNINLTAGATGSKLTQGSTIWYTYEITGVDGNGDPDVYSVTDSGQIDSNGQFDDEDGVSGLQVTIEKDLVLGDDEFRLTFYSADPRDTGSELGFTEAAAYRDAIQIDIDQAEGGEIIDGALVADILSAPDPITGIFDGPGTVNLNNKGVTPFTLFGSDELNVEAIKVDSLAFGGKDSRIGVAQKKNGSPFAAYEDANEDGELDLVVKVETSTFAGMAPSEPFEVFGSLNDGTEVVFGLNEGDSINFI